MHSIDANGYVEVTFNWPSVNFMVLFDRKKTHIYKYICCCCCFMFDFCCCSLLVLCRKKWINWNIKKKMLFSWQENPHNIYFSVWNHYRSLSRMVPLWFQFSKCSNRCVFKVTYIKANWLVTPRVTFIHTQFVIYNNC